MPEPTDVNELFAHFDPEVPVPLDAADIRRRGDRLRRRNVGLAAAGAVAVVALIAAPLAALSGGGDVDALPPAEQQTTQVTDPSPSPSADPSPEAEALQQSDLLEVGDLPSRDRLGEWVDVNPGGEPVLQCMPVGYDVASVTSAAEALPAFDPQVTNPSDVPMARMRTAIYEFPDADSASGALAEVGTQLSTCEEFAGLKAGPYTRPGALAGGEYVEWRLFTYGDPEICTECDGMWFDRMGIAQVGDRLLVLSYAEVGGPLQPDGLETVMRDLMTAAVGRAAS